MITMAHPPFKLGPLASLSDKQRDVLEERLPQVQSQTNSHGVRLCVAGSPAMTWPRGPSSNLGVSPERGGMPRGLRNSIDLPTWGKEATSKGRLLAWFPIALEPGAYVFFVLDYSSAAEYSRRTLVEVWFSIQQQISEALFLSKSNEHLSSIALAWNDLATPRGQILPAYCLAHLMISPRAMDWDRFWLFGESPNKNGVFNLLTSHHQQSLSTNVLQAATLAEEIRVGFADYRNRPNTPNGPIVIINPNAPNCRCLFSSNDFRETQPAVIFQTKQAKGSSSHWSDFVRRCLGADIGVQIVLFLLSRSLSRNVSILLCYTQNRKRCLALCKPACCSSGGVTESRISTGPEVSPNFPLLVDLAIWA